MVDEGQSNPSHQPSTINHQPFPVRLDLGGLRMRITKARVIPVALPDPPLRNSTGVHEPFALRNLLRLETDDGLVGWGEASGGARVTQEMEAAREAVLGLD